MEIRDGILYASVSYPKDIKEVHTQAIKDGLKGYSVHTEDGRFFKWNDALSKAEIINQQVYYFNENNTKAEAITSNKESSNVKAVRDKINSLKNENVALSTTVATLTSDKQRLEKQVADKDTIITQLKNQVAVLEADKTRLQSEIDEIVNL